MKYILTIFLTSLTIVSCKEDPNKVESLVVYPKPLYKTGDIVYLKPDSTKALITEKTQWDSLILYRVGYKLKTGKIIYQSFKEFEIYGKK